MAGFHVSYIATSDSYLKWVAGFFERSPHSWNRSLTLIAHADNPSPRQVRDALVTLPDAAQALQHSSLRNALRTWRTSPPDIIVVGGPGPFMSYLRARLDRTTWGKKIPLAGGSPGLANHLSDGSLRYRDALDILITASLTERSELGARWKKLVPHGSVALSTLPFLQLAKSKPRNQVDTQTFYFASQPDIPKSRSDREQVLLRLISIARRNPSSRVVVKLRAVTGEPQTHREFWPYPDIFDQLVSRGMCQSGDLSFESGPMSSILDNPSAVLITVSSTAAIEAIASGNPTIIASDFGLSENLANEVFRGSGIARELSSINAPFLDNPDPRWLTQNYFHDSELDDWVEIFEKSSTHIADNDRSRGSRVSRMKNSVTEGLRTRTPGVGRVVLGAYNSLTKRRR